MIRAYCGGALILIAMGSALRAAPAQSVSFASAGMAFVTIKGELLPDAQTIRLVRADRAVPGKHRVSVKYQPAADWLTLAVDGRALPSDSLIDIPSALTLRPSSTSLEAAVYSATIEIAAVDAATSASLLVVTYTVSASDGIADWAARHGVVVRKTFDGSKDENSPANIFWVNSSAGSGTSSLIDVALKLSEYAASDVLYLYPAMEYHRSTDEKRPINTVSLAARAEWRPVSLALPGKPGGWKFAPTIIVDGKLGREYVADATELRLSAQATVTSLTRFAPGASIRVGRTHVGRYYPYLGVERYTFATAGKDSTVAFGTARLWAEAFPIAYGPYRFLQLTVDWSARRRWSGATFASAKVLHDVTTGATLYLDGRQHVGLGVDHARGNEANKQFVFRERTSVGLKIKI